jgi:hypothetical protein
LSSKCRDPCRSETRQSCSSSTRSASGPTTGWRPPSFFTLVSARYERGSIILTSNKGFGEWGEVLGDPVIATAILDRLLHHSHVLNIRGESYRLREKKQAGLLAVGPAALTGSRDAAANDHPPGVGQLQTGEGGSKVRRR